MRLLTYTHEGQLSIMRDLFDHIPPYAILSHTWIADEEEVTHQELQHNTDKRKAGYRKIEFCGEQAKRDGITHFWVDTCCIDKANHVELSEAIASMYRWYQQAQKCYVYLADVSTRKRSVEGDHLWEASFEASRWFTRGWTLQELLAPRVVEFFSREGDLLGTKQTLASQIHKTTSIPLAALHGAPLTQFPIPERIRWSQERRTKKKEDRAYCLLGIFDVFMPLIYGEGENALRRLEKEINERYGAGVASGLSGSPATRSLGLCLKSAPIIPPSDFVGRAHEIGTLHDILRPDQAPTEQHRAVLGGIGGIGKTQLALAYARQHQQSYMSVLWLNATSESTLNVSLRSIAQRIRPATELQGLDDDGTLQAVLHWLSDTRNTSWLLIFDNYDDPDLYGIDRYLPNTGHGSIIITTRLPDLVQGQRMQQVRVCSISDLDESLEILQTRSRRGNVQHDPDARRLAKRLAGLPLALATAGAYLLKTTVTFGQYLDAYERRFNVNPRQPTRLQEYPDRTLYTTWDLSYNRLEQDDVLAARTLKLLAYLDNQEIWYELLRAGVDNESSSWLQEVTAEHVDFENVMGTLVDYCLLEAHPTTRSYSMHNCVHDWTLAQLNQTVSPDQYWYVVACVVASVDDDDWNMLGRLHYARLARHAVRLVHSRFLRDANLNTMSAKHLSQLHSVARLLSQQVHFSAAETLYYRALAGKEDVLGPDHSSTLTTVNNLGILCKNQGKLNEAERMFLRALAGREKVLGLDHSLTLTTVNNLGVLYKNQGKLDEAERMFLRALAGKENTLGLDHAKTLQTVHNLGHLYIDQGKLNIAQQMLERALAGRRHILGPSHTKTLDTVNILGVLHYNQGKLDRAKHMYTQALAGRAYTLGPDHTSTLNTVNNLSSLYRDQGKLDDAEQMYRRAIAGYEKALGPNHTSTLRTARTLSELYRDQGKANEAEQVETRYKL